MIQEINISSNAIQNGNGPSAAENQQSNGGSVNFIDLLRSRMQPSRVINNDGDAGFIQNNGLQEAISSSSRESIVSEQRNYDEISSNASRDSEIRRPDPVGDEDTRAPREETAVQENSAPKEEAVVQGNEESQQNLEESPAEENNVNEDHSKVAEGSKEDNGEDADSSSTVKDSEISVQLQSAAAASGNSDTVSNLPVRELTESIEQLLQSITSNADNENSEIRNLMRDIRNLTGRLNREPGNETLQQTLSKLESLMERLEGRTTARSGKIMANLASILRRANARAEQNRPGETANQNLSVEIKNLSARLENILNSMSRDSSGNSSMEEGSSRQNNNFSFNFMKNDTGLRRANINVNSAEINRNFKQQMQEVIDNARISVRNNRNASVSLRLYPRNLGRLNVNIGLEHGVINGRFLVETEEARTLLMNNLDSIRDKLEESGIEVGAFQVNVSDQRERPDSSDTEHSDISVLPIQDLPEVMTEYEDNAAVYHNGEINLVI
jgi:flagellar hook-length control protein FliK